MKNPPYRSSGEDFSFPGIVIQGSTLMPNTVRLPDGRVSVSDRGRMRLRIRTMIRSRVMAVTIVMAGDEQKNADGVVEATRWDSPRQWRYECRHGLA